MNLSIYDADLRRVLIIGERFTSCLWSEGYNTSEPFTLELTNLPEYRQKIRPDMYVGRTDRSTLMLIQGVRAENNHLIVTGKQATKRLADLAFIGTIAASPYVDRALRTEYDKSRKLPHLEFANPTLNARYSHQISNKDFEELAQTMCKATDCGFRVRRDGNKMVAEVYQPEDNPNLIFSEDYGNLKILSITLGNANYKNYAIVLGMGEMNLRVRQDVDLTNGEPRKDLIIDARDIQLERGEKDADYKNRLAARGVEKLIEHSDVSSFKVLPNANDFGSRYDLGDVVHIRIGGSTISARIIRFTQKAKQNQISTTIEVGKPMR